MKDDSFLLAGVSYSSRLLVGTGRYRDAATARAAIDASGAQIVTVAVRRVDLAQPQGEALWQQLRESNITLLPNSAGCYNVEDAVRTLRLARELGGWKLVKLEVIADANTLLPHPEYTLEAAKILAKEGFDVMAYTTDDLTVAKKLEDAGCVAVMPLAAPIGSGLGIVNPPRIEAIARALTVPVLVDAGIGTASDACIAMELGCAGVLLNTALAEARDPVKMAAAMKLAVEAGRHAFMAGRMPKRDTAQPSSPQSGVITES